MTAPQWMNIKEAAHELRFVELDGTVQRKALYSYLRRHHVETKTRGGKTLLINRAELLATVKERP